MKKPEASDIAFQADGKETFKERLKQLIGSRSVRAAAKDWGISVSTLNNYLNRGTEPTLSIINQLSELEHVSIDWLARGYVWTDVPEPIPHRNEDSTDVGELKKVWLMVFEALEPQEASSLVKAIHRNGVVGVLNGTHQHSSRTVANSTDDIENLVDALPLRETLKQAIKVAAAGDEAMDREILHRLEQVQKTSSTGTDVTREQADSRNVG
ncbi:hypothetical protein EYD79_00870 [Shigella sonnei]|nr:hypothetical protein [Escherichia coli]EFW5532188.1 hypothetical protein [Shigella sonnei]EGA6848492.1 hypothetical protein [Shigella sonnei]EKC9672201.1 hypothetical protein [Escherichia coli]